MSWFLFEFWSVVVQMAPYLLLGFLVAGILSIIIPAAMIERHLGGRGLGPVIKASFVGVPLPLCSCGVLPVAASMHKHGASKGATVSFLLSTPETGIDSIFVTWSLLGPVFAIFRPIVAFVTGIVGGTAVDIVAHGSSRTVQNSAQKSCCSSSCCTSGSKRSGKIMKSFSFGFKELPKDIGGPMLIGILIAAVISIAIPDNFFEPFLGGGILSMFIMMAIGVPTYVCASASVPIAAALIAKGVSPGAAWVFLMTGPATNAAAIAMIWNILGHKTTITYLISLVACALASGILFDYMAGTMNVITMHEHAEFIPAWLCNILGLVLVTLLMYGIFLKYRSKSKHATLTA